MTQQVKTDFTEAEARRTDLQIIMKGDLRPSEAVVLLAAIGEAQEDALAQEQQANAALLGFFEEFRRLVCTAAHALAMPGACGENRTGFPDGVGAGHVHEVFSEDGHQGLAAVAALDTSGYAPHPEDVGTLVEGTGTGEPPVPPRYETREEGLKPWEHRGPDGKIYTRPGRVPPGKGPSLRGATPS